MRHPQSSPLSLDLQSPWLFSDAPRTRVDYRREVGSGYGSSVLMAPVNWVARTFPEAPLVVEQETPEGFEKVLGHDLTALLRQPNPFYSGTTLWMATLSSWILSGNAYWIKVRNAQRKPIELWYVPHWMIGPKWPEDGSVFISHYEYRPKGYGERIEMEDVIHFRHGMTPHNPRLGLSPLHAVLREVFTDDEASRFTATVLRNMGVIGIVMSPKEGGITATEDDVAETKKKLMERFTGSRLGEPLVMDRATDVYQYGFSLDKMDLSSIRNISEERVCAALGIPAAVVGFGTGLQQTKVGATMKELRRLAWEGNLIPTQRFFSEALEGSLLPDFEERPEQFRVVFDRSDVEAMKESENELNERLATAVKGGYMQVAEAREEKGLEVTDADRIYLRPIAMIEVPAGEPRPDLPEKGRKIAADPEPLLPEEAPPRRQPNAMQRRIVEMNERNHAAFSARFQQELERFFDGLGKDAARIAREVLKSAKPGSTKEIAEEIEGQQILDEMALEIAQRTLQEKGGRHYLRVAQETFIGVSTILGLEIGLPDPVAREIVATGGTRMGLIDLRKQTRERLFRELTEGRAAGEGIPQLVARIRDKIPAGRYQDAATRAKVIARTETKHAQRTSVIRACKESGVVTHMLVLDDRLGHGDADCAFWNGWVVTLEDAQELGNQEHPSGTRDFAPVIP